MDAYILLTALGSGAIGIILGLFEVRLIYRFIMKNQNLKHVPLVNKNTKEKEVNATIRKFRKDIFSNALITDLTFSSLRKKLRIFRYMMLTCTLIMFILLFVLYWNSRN